MKSHIYTLLILAACAQQAFAQNGCPGCKVQLPANLSADTVYLPVLPPGQQGEPYSQDIAFRLPKTTTPVYSIDSVTPPGLTISKIEILNIENLPAGLSWQANQTVFDPAKQTDGCVKLCGVPLATDTFELLIRLKATVLIINQETSFSRELLIKPAKSATPGFSMSNYIGCGAAVVSFANNNPSGGAEGFTYEWDFGDGTTFKGEQPPPHTYKSSGRYEVNYKAVIDTVGPVLDSIVILNANCADLAGLGAPDIYVLVKNSEGKTIFDSSPDILNADFPLKVPIKVKVGAGNFDLLVVDEDSGLEGSDDLCGQISFNRLSNDTLVSGGLRVVLHISRPIKEITSKDTVIVFPLPSLPRIDAPEGLKSCGKNLRLVSNYPGGNHWLRGNKEISGATGKEYEVTQTGYYAVRYTSPETGCSITSDSIYVEINPLPAEPAFTVVKNRLKVIDTTALPPQYALQWYEGSNAISGAMGLSYCATQSGNYGLEVIDTKTGCRSFYYQAVTVDPAFDCTVGTADEWAQGRFVLYPNPASVQTQLQWDAPLSQPATARVFDAAGRICFHTRVAAGAQSLLLDASSLPAGLFTVELCSDARCIQRKWAVVK